MSVLSKDGITWSTKLERIGELSLHKQSMVFNNLGHLITSDALMEQYQQLPGNKAAGIDKVTKSSYGENLEVRISELIQQIRRGTYKPQASRITFIPKEDGSERPLAISCFEDKLVQSVVGKLLTAIYEPLFLPCSYGYRPNKNCHDALRALNRATFSTGNGAIVEIDISKYFNTIPHQVLMKFLRTKISDRRFLRLIEVLITAPILEGNVENANIIGCPQGSIVSPILANIFLHVVIDEWFNSIASTHIRGNAKLVRFADDMVFIFEHYEEAQRFFKVLPKRLEKFGLQIHTEKSQVIKIGDLAAKAAYQQGRKLPTFNFLGFTCYWGKARKGFWRLKYTSRRDRFSAKLKSMRLYLRKNLNGDTNTILKAILRVVRGWINYHAVSDNERKVGQFLQRVKRIIFWWINRRGGRKRTNWKQFTLLLKRIGFPSTWKTVSMFKTH